MKSNFLKLKFFQHRREMAECYCRTGRDPEFYGRCNQREVSRKSRLSDERSRGAIQDWPKSSLSRGERAPLARGANRR